MTRAETEIVAADESTAATARFEADLARDLMSARDGRATTRPPTRRAEEFGLDQAYRVGAALDRRLQRRGYHPIGCKVGFTNRAIWPRFGLDEPILAPVYDRTLRLSRPTAEIPIGMFRAPMIEVEVVFGLAQEGVDEGRPEWVALGFEIVDCHYPEWHLTPADSVADFGLHGALVVGRPVNVRHPGFDELVARLDDLEVRLFRNETPVARGRGSDVLGHPLAALDFVPRLFPRFARPEAPPSGGGDPPSGVVSTGTMTALEALSPGERWRVEAAGVHLPGMEIVLTG